jgi:hypothetical protein
MASLDAVKESLSQQRWCVAYFLQNGSKAGGEGMKTFLVTHKFVLESTDVAETPRSVVAVQLLGPFSVRWVKAPPP